MCMGKRNSNQKVQNLLRILDYHKMLCILPKLFYAYTSQSEDKSLVKTRKYYNTFYSLPFLLNNVLWKQFTLAHTSSFLMIMSSNVWLYYNITVSSLPDI